MAIVKKNTITKGLSGTIGDLVFRQSRGRTIVVQKPKKSEKVSEAQSERRSKFQEAVHYAKSCMADASLKAYYEKEAKRKPRTHAYNLAISDYMKGRSELVKKNVAQQ